MCKGMITSIGIDPLPHNGSKIRSPISGLATCNKLYEIVDLKVVIPKCDKFRKCKDSSVTANNTRTSSKKRIKSQID